MGFGLCVHGLIYPMIANAYTNAKTETPNKNTAATKTGNVFFLNASLLPTDFASCFSRIALCTCRYLFAP
jgi:hypothetical protein